VPACMGRVQRGRYAVAFGRGVDVGGGATLYHDDRFEAKVGVLVALELTGASTSTDGTN
jgi:hypothetical protein